MFLVEVFKQSRPPLLGRFLTRHLQDGLPHHLVGFLLVVPTVFHPQTCMSVPFSYSRTMNPCHASRMDTASYADGLIHAQHLFRTTSVEVSKRQAVAIYSLI